MYWSLRGLWGPINLVASCVAETKAILPNLMGVHWDSAWATFGCSSQYRVEDMHYGEVGPDHLLDRIVKCGHSWCLCASQVSYCQVLSLAR
jgi:hypothetical protein